MWFNQYPYLNLNDLNLDYLIKAVRDLRYQLENFININTIKYANPIQWKITTQYEANTVVIDANDGTAYLSGKPVPSGVALTNTDYWTPIFTLNLLSANQNITLRDDGSNVLATFGSVAGDWLIWNNTLYKVSQAINVNEAYVVGYNLDRFSVELFIKEYIGDVITLIGDLNDLNTTDKDNIVDAINEVLTIIGALSDLATTDKTSIVNAVNEINTNVNDNSEDIATLFDIKYYANVKEYGAIGNGTHDDRQAFIDAIATGKKVVVPSGYYRISEPIEVPAGVNIMGVGVDKTYINFDAQTQAQRYVFYNTTATQKSGATFKDFTLNVNNYNNTNQFIGGFLLQQFDDVLIDGVEIVNTSDGGNGVTLWNCSNGTVSNCYCHELRGDGIYICNGSHSIDVINNKVINCLVSSGCIDLYNVYHVTCKNNFVQPNNTSTFGFNLDTVEHCIIEGNTCFNGSRGIATFVINNSVIANNICRQNSQFGIQMEISVDGVTTSNNNIVNGNSIDHSQIGILDATKGNFNKIVNNFVGQSERHGIYIIGCNYEDITNNTVAESGLEIANTYSDIYVKPDTTPISYTTIKGNTCNSPQVLRNIVTIADVSNNMVVNNSCLAFGGDYNIVIADQTGLIFANNRGTDNVP